MTKKHSKVTIKIPSELYDNLANRIKNTGFVSVTEFITFTLRTIVSGKSDKEDNLSEKEIKMVKDRLKALGYI
jgi:metal-responsive CopG/Arc/MetJ family transcriptional regulator